VPVITRFGLDERGRYASAEVMRFELDTRRRAMARGQAVSFAGKKRRRILFAPSTLVDNPGIDCRDGLTSRRHRSHCGTGAARGSRVRARVQRMKTTNCPPMTCHRCGDQRNVHKNLTTPYAQYWRCAGCGEVWATAKSTSDSSTFDESKPHSKGTVRRFFTDTRTIATGAALAVFGVLYVVRRKYGRHDSASKQ